MKLATQADREFEAQLRAIPTSTPHLSQMLARKARAGDAAAQAELTSRNWRLVFLVITRKFANLPVERDSLEYADLVQEGMRGLARAARTFDPSRNNSFAPYAMAAIHAAIVDSMRNQDTIRVTQSEKIQHREFAANERALTRELERPATLAEIAERSGVPLESVVNWVERPRVTTSLETPINELQTLGDVLPADGESEEARATAMSEDDIEVLTALQKTNTRRGAIAAQIGISRNELRWLEPYAHSRAGMPTGALLQLPADETIAELTIVHVQLAEAHYGRGESTRDAARAIGISYSQAVASMRELEAAVDAWALHNPEFRPSAVAAVIDAHRAELGMDSLAVDPDPAARRAREAEDLRAAEEAARREEEARREREREEAMRASVEAREIRSPNPLPYVDFAAAAISKAVWEVGERAVIGGEPGAQIAADLGMTTHEVDLARRQLRYQFEKWQEEHPERDFADFRATRAQSRALIREHLGELTDDQAAVTEALYLSGRYIREIAEERGQGVAAVSKRASESRAVITAFTGNLDERAQSRAMREAARLEAATAVDPAFLAIDPAGWTVVRATYAHTGKAAAATPAGREAGLNPSAAKTRQRRGFAVVDEWLAANPGATFEDFVTERESTLEKLGRALDELPLAIGGATRGRLVEHRAAQSVCAEVGVTNHFLDRNAQEGLEQAARGLAADARAAARRASRRQTASIAV